MTEESQYDEIFTALKHPVRRQILLFIDTKGEASFTEIQQETGITDTGLMSYHLKGLASLVEQSKRGKYQLSEVGQAGITLLRKADHEREHTSTVIHEEIERFIGLSIKKSVLFLLIAGLALLIPMTVDILFSVNILVKQEYSTLELTGALSATTAVMVLSVFLFILYDKQYYAKTLKSSIIHSTAFTIGISLLSVCFFNQLYSFNQATASVGVGQVVSNQSIPWLFEIIRITIFIASAPTIAYLLSKRPNEGDKTIRQT